MITKTLILTAFGVNDADSPGFAKVEVSEADLHRLEAVREACTDHKINLAILSSEVPLAAFGTPTDEEETDYEAENRLYTWELHLSGDSVWWRADFKHSSDAVESHMVSLATLRDAMKGSEPVVYIREGVIDATLAADVAALA